MSLPVFVLNQLVLDAEDMSDDITSDPIDVGEVGGFAVHSEFTDAPVGTLVISASNDLDMTFIAIDSYSVAAAGSRLVNVEMPRYKYIKVTYTSTSGTGELSVRVSGKQI